METYFENISLDSVQKTCEIIWHFQRKAIVRTLLIWGIGAVMLLAAGLLWESTLCLLIGAAYAVMFVWQLFKPRRAAKKAYDKKLAFYDNTMPPITYLFYDDHFSCTDIDSQRIVSYDKITGVVLLKYCVTVTVADGSGYCIDNDGFQKGTREELRSFLQSKCPQINSAKWQW